MQNQQENSNSITRNELVTILHEERKYYKQLIEETIQQEVRPVAKKLDQVKVMLEEDHRAVVTDVEGHGQRIVVLEHQRA
jgi:hypothetical protein